MVNKRDLSYFLLALPAIVYVGYFAFYPAFKVIILSFWDPATSSFSLVNYKSLSYFNPGGAAINTIIISLGALFVQLLIALGVASILANEFRGKRAFSVITTYSLGIATVVSAIAFSLIFQPVGGYANTLLHLLGSKGIDWYSNYYLKVFVVDIADSWKNTPMMILILLSGMMSIPQEIYYAAAIDGANMLNRFIHITLPNLLPFIAIALIIRGVSEFNIFALPLILIGFHPPLLTTLVYELYSTGASVYLSYAAATILIGFISIFILLNILIGRRR
ncbi:MAG: sugar ABC transporter permease [Sulfolobaceae archaeon]|nr:sugar ABC transporter permease [Sulfolobaceae archaeon]